MKLLLATLTAILLATACNGGGARTNDQIIWSSNPDVPWELRHNHDLVAGTYPSAWVEFIVNDGPETGVQTGRDIELCLTSMYLDGPDPEDEVLRGPIVTCSSRGFAYGWDDNEFLSVVGPDPLPGEFAHAWESTVEQSRRSEPPLYFSVFCDYHDANGSNPESQFSVPTPPNVQCDGRTPDHTGQN